MLSPGDVVGEVTAVPGITVDVVPTLENQRWNRIAGRTGLISTSACIRRYARALPGLWIRRSKRAPPPSEGLVRRHPGRQALQERAGAPSRLDVLDKASVPSRVPPPRIVIVAQGPGLR